MKIHKLALQTALVAATLTSTTQAATVPSYEMRIMVPGIKPSSATVPVVPPVVPPVVAPVVVEPPPVVVVPPPAAGSATGLLESPESTDFGSVWAGASRSRVFRFTNVGNAPALGLYGQATGTDLTVTATNCGTAGIPVTLGAGQSCDFTVSYWPTSASTLNGTVSVAGSYTNSPSSLHVTGSGYQAAVGTLTANTTADFGSVALSGSSSRSFTLTNSGNVAATGVSANVTATTGLVMGANTCGTQAVPVSLAAGASCGITLTYSGSTASRLSGVALAVAGSFSSTPAQITLTGAIGGFDVVAAWSSSVSSTIAPTSAFLSYGQQTRGSLTTKDIFVRSTRTNGGPAVGFTLSGDVSQFNISRVVTNNGSGTYSACPSGGVLAANKLSSTPCLASSYPNIVLSLQYAPTVVGSHQIVVTPITNNGTALPEAIALTGSSQFNPTAVWSTSTNSVVTPTAATLSYGTKLTGSSTVKTFYLKNVGTNGALGVGFALDGDTSHFKITRLDKISSGGSSDVCISGGAIAANKLSTTVCRADDMTASRSLIELQVTYQPAAAGHHSVTVNTVTDNGTILPTAISLTGTGL